MKKWKPKKHKKNKGMSFGAMLGAALAPPCGSLVRAPAPSSDGSAAATTAERQPGRERGGAAAPFLLMGDRQ